MGAYHMRIEQYDYKKLGKLVCLFTVVAALLTAPVYARDIGIAFIEDGLGEPSPRLSDLVVQELQPLLGSGNTVVPIFLGRENASPNVMDSLSWALANPEVDYIVTTGFVGSQTLYQESRYSKPTYLLRVLDPTLTGHDSRANVKNLRGYSSSNQIADVFERLSELFQAKRVGIILPSTASGTQRSIGRAVGSAAKKADIQVRFLAIDFSQDIQPQLADLDAVVVPPVTVSKRDRSVLFKALQQKKIPSFAVGGDAMVLSGALISDTVNENDRVLARRVSLDLQQSILSGVRTQGMRMIDPEKRTTINIDTARALGIDFAFDEIMNARLVQGSSSDSALSLLASFELATNRNLGLLGQFQQLRIDEESLNQARAARGPQISAQLQNTHRGEQRPEEETLAAVGLSLTLYSPAANAQVDIAKLGVDASRLMLEQTQLDTIQQTASAYFFALQTQALFESQLRNLSLNRENLLLAEQRKRSGSAAGAEIYQWQSVIAGSENAVLQAYTDNMQVQSSLAQLLNQRIQIPTQLADIELDQPPFDLLHEGLSPYLKSTQGAQQLRQTSAARAIDRSPQLQAAEANVDVSDTRLTATRQSYYSPELSLSAQYARYLDSSVNAAGIELDDQDDWSVTLSARLPLWDGGTRRSQIHQSIAQQELAKTQVQTVRMSLWVNSGNAVNQLIANYRAIELSTQAEAAAFKSQQIMQSAYRLGAASVTELLETQNQFLQAQENAHVARYQYLTALVEFQALMGEMPMLMPKVEQQQWLQNFIKHMNNGVAQ